MFGTKKSNQTHTARLQPIDGVAEFSVDGRVIAAQPNPQTRQPTRMIEKDLQSTAHAFTSTEGT